jgi:hypothetical protein
MAKGWESKSIEEQQADAAAPRPATSEVAIEAKRAEADRKRRLQALEMQRERTSSPHRRSALELALATIEHELEQLGWSIKL